MLKKNSSQKQTLFQSSLTMRKDEAFSFSPRYQVRKKNPIENCNKRQESKQLQKYNDSWWSLEENIAYAEFLQQNLHLFEKTREEKRLMKINVLISRHVKTRSSDQCRSHHQKMLKYHSSVGQIIDYILSLKPAITNEESKQISRKAKEIPEQPSMLFQNLEIIQIDFAYLPPLDFFENVLIQNQSQFLG